MEACKPYLIKWQNSECSSMLWQNLVFLNPNTSYYDEPESYAQNISLVGTWKPITLIADDKSALYLGSGNTLHYPAADISINAFHAYFDLIGLTAGDLPSNVKNFVLNFDDNATGLADLKDSKNHSDSWFTLDGRRLNGKPQMRGIYINDGQKVLIK